MLSFTALAEPTRFQIVELLAKHGRLPASQISKRFPVSPPAISQHLKVLKEAKLVTVEVQAQQRIYALNQAGIREIDQWLSRVKAQWEARFDALDALLTADTKKAKKSKRKTPRRKKP